MKGKRGINFKENSLTSMALNKELQEFVLHQTLNIQYLSSCLFGWGLLQPLSLFFFLFICTITVSVHTLICGERKNVTRKLCVMESPKSKPVVLLGNSGKTNVLHQE